MQHRAQPQYPAKKTTGEATTAPIRPYEINLDQVHGSIQRSLRNLNAKYVDVLLLHEALPEFLTTDAKDYIFSLRRDGVAKRIGIAANGANYVHLSQQELSDWDVLQYELSPSHPSHFDFQIRFPDLHHIVHSCVGSSPQLTRQPREAIQEALTHLPRGTVLFSSLQRRHIEQNALAVLQPQPIQA
jgi:aryl-alcohol dehydrogenase-like predicted oxidoreductase